MQYSTIDSIAASIPQAQTYSIESIADYFGTRFLTDEAKARAIHFWLASHLSYDVEASLNPQKVYTQKEMSGLLVQALKDRKGICFHYTLLFQRIGERLGVESHIVHGYTKMHGQVMPDPHQWLVVRIDGEWFFFDPTWAAGYVEDLCFIPRLDDTYYKVVPAEMIKTHMPFDPMWQFLDYPLRYEEFDYSDLTLSQANGFFNWRAALMEYECSDEEQQLIAANARMEANGAGNSLVEEDLFVNQHLMEGTRNKAMMRVCCQAMKCYNEGIQQWLGFVSLKNKCSQSDETESAMRKLIGESERAFLEAYRLLNGIETNNPQLLATIAGMKQNIDTVLGNVQGH